MLQGWGWLIRAVQCPDPLREGEQRVLVFDSLPLEAAGLQVLGSRPLADSLPWLDFRKGGWSMGLYLNAPGSEWSPHQAW